MKFNPLIITTIQTRYIHTQVIKLSGKFTFVQKDCFVKKFNRQSIPKFHNQNPSGRRKKISGGTNVFGTQRNVLASIDRTGSLFYFRVTMTEDTHSVGYACGCDFQAQSSLLVFVFQMRAELESRCWVLMTVLLMVRDHR